MEFFFFWFDESVSYLVSPGVDISISIWLSECDGEADEMTLKESKLLSMEEELCIKLRFRSIYILFLFTKQENKNKNKSEIKIKEIKKSQNGKKKKKIKNFYKKEIYCAFGCKMRRRGKSIRVQERKVVGCWAGTELKIYRVAVFLPYECLRFASILSFCLV